MCGDLDEIDGSVVASEGLAGVVVAEGHRWKVEEGPGTILAWAKMVQQESDVCPVMSGACCLLCE